MSDAQRNNENEQRPLSSYDEDERRSPHTPAPQVFDTDGCEHTGTEPQRSALEVLVGRGVDGICDIHIAERQLFPDDPAERKAAPVASGVLDYFPAALVEVAKVSKAGNDQHNPGQPLHWARGKSTDQADCILRHFLERGTFDSDGQRHSAKLVWRALALLQLELEAGGYPVARGAR